MKKFRIIFVLLAGLLISCSPVIAQSLTSGMWQLQNPSVPSNSEMAAFDSQGRFTYSICNLGTGQVSVGQGNYKLSGNLLTFNFDNGNSTSFRLRWINSHKMALADANGFSLYFGMTGTSEDKFMSNYLLNSPSSSYPSYSTGTYQHHEVCYTCHGSGRCVVCRGMGYTTGYYGERFDCKACGGTGKCWHCNGSGEQ